MAFSSCRVGPLVLCLSSTGQGPRAYGRVTWEGIKRSELRANLVASSRLSVWGQRGVRRVCSVRGLLKTGKLVPSLGQPTRPVIADAPITRLINSINGPSLKIHSERSFFFGLCEQASDKTSQRKKNQKKKENERRKR